MNRKRKSFQQKYCTYKKFAFFEKRIFMKDQRQVNKSNTKEPFFLMSRFSNRKKATHIIILKLFMSIIISRILWKMNLCKMLQILTTNHLFFDDVGGKNIYNNILVVVVICFLFNIQQKRVYVHVLLDKHFCNSEQPL